MQKVNEVVRQFSTEDDGAQIIEYALIISLVAIALLVALRGITGADFDGLVMRVVRCLSNQPSCG